jgi:hypothetical protein
MVRLKKISIDLAQVLYGWIIFVAKDQRVAFTSVYTMVGGYTTVDIMKTSPSGALIM